MRYRNTKQRERILELLKGTDLHPTAEWIYMKLKDEIPSLSLGTVYRNLKILMEQGEIRNISFGGSDRFDGNTLPHYHIECEICGIVKDVEIPECASINEIAEQLSAFKVSRHTIEFFGICENCLKNQKE